MMTTDTSHTYNVYYNDCVNEVNNESPLAIFATLEDAKKFADEYANARTRVDNEHECSEDVFISAKVAHCEVYVDGIMMMGEDDEPEIADPIYITQWFYAD
jgi:hypothetical protein